MDFQEKDYNMIGIDFTFIDLDKMSLTGSLEVFTCDIRNCIAAQNQEDNFVIIVHPVVENMIRQKFPTFKIYAIGGIFFKILYGVFAKNGINKAKKYSLYDTLLKIHGITKIWFPYMLPVIVQGCKCDYIGTCHDLMQINKKNSDGAYKQMFEGATQVITISNYVKNQIIKKYKINSEKITVIPNSIYFSTNKIPVESIPELAGKEFLFDCNAFTPRKNTLVLIKAFERLQNKISEDLALCGGYKTDGYFEMCEQYIKEHSLADRIHLFLGIDEKQKNWLFENCKLFITPSENEGFGRTPIEAALFFKPVISSRATSLEEATCGMVHYIEDPRDDEKLADVITHVLQKPDNQEQLIKIRETFVQKYSPEHIVQEYINVFYGLGWIEPNKERGRYL